MMQLHLAKKKGEVDESIATMKLAIVLTLFYCTLVSNANPLTPSNYQDTPDGKYPYVVSVKLSFPGYPEYEKHMCSGTIINNRWILTSGYCVLLLFDMNVRIAAGTNLLDGGNEQVYEADNWISHEKMESSMYEYDIGLIHVISDIEFNDKVQPVKLPTEDFNKSGYPITLTGWTYRGDDGLSLSNNLREVTLKVIDQKTCQKEWPTEEWGYGPTDNHICLSNGLQQDKTCLSDFGSPIIADGVQIGIISKQHYCFKTMPELDTKVFNFLDWVAEKQAEF